MASVNDSDSRFWAKVQKGKPTECWLWLGAKKPKGYGNVRRNKKYTTAHRVAWEITFGEAPRGMQVQHSCDTPSCCNPNHLMLGTVVSNYVDMVKKGRDKSNHGNRRRGESHHNHKLKASEVEEIRRLYQPGEVRQQDLAEKYGVSQSAISSVVRKEVRNHG